MNSSRVQVPATSANLGPGFDVLGVALPLYNEVLMEADHGGSWSSTRRHIDVSIEVQGEGFDTLPRDGSNLVARAAYRVFGAAKKWPVKLRVVCLNRIPLSRGLGSSAAAVIGGMCAANRLCGQPLSDAELINLALAFEGHPDNVVPAFCGGFCIAGVVDQETRYMKFKVPGSLRAVLCIPHKQISTAEARRALPSRVPLNAAVFTSSHVAFLLAALWQKKYEWLSFAMDDVIHQPARAHLLPGLKEVIAEAREAGAWGAALSGAGSTVIAFSKPGNTAKRVGQAMQRRFASKGVSSQWLELPLTNHGVRYR